MKTEYTFEEKNVMTISKYIDENYDEITAKISKAITEALDEYDFEKAVKEKVKSFLDQSVGYAFSIKRVSRLIEDKIKTEMVRSINEKFKNFKLDFTYSAD